MKGDIGGLRTPQKKVRNTASPQEKLMKHPIYITSLTILASACDNTQSMMHSAASVAAFSELTVLIFPHVYRLNWLWPNRVAEVKLPVKLLTNEKGLAA